MTLGLLLCAAAQLAQAAPEVIRLWPEGVPVPIRLDPAMAAAAVAEPTLTVQGPLAEHGSGTAVIILPGGGYLGLAANHEGEEYARELTKLGITTFLLRYRVRTRHPAPLQDVLRAIRLVRSEAVRFGISPDRIGVMGSSAGGHLAASAATLYDHPVGRTGSDLDKVNARPDFLVLIYPVITMEAAFAHRGSRSILLGENPTVDEVRLLSVEKQVTHLTPPTLLVHTQEDQVVSVDNSILFYQALTRAKVPAEMYLFQRGPHGMGMRLGLGTFSGWPKRTEEWLKARGLLDKAQ